MKAISIKRWMKAKGETRSLQLPRKRGASFNMTTLTDAVRKRERM